MPAVLATLVPASAEAALAAFDALADAGVAGVLFEGNPSLAARAIARVRAGYRGSVQLGAAGLLDGSAIEDAVAAGAQILSSPVLPKEVRGRHDGVVLLGACTPAEVVAARAWADVVEVFPAGPLGPGYFASLRAAFPEVPLGVAGGLSPETARSFVQAGARTVRLTTVELRPEWDSQSLAAAAQRFVAAVRGATRLPPAPPVKPIEGPDTR